MAAFVVTPVEHHTCPHCLSGFSASFHATTSPGNAPGIVAFTRCTNPACSKLIVGVASIGVDISQLAKVALRQHLTIAYPRCTSRAPLDPRIPDPYRKDVAEAEEVLSISPKACAALSRRCLQRLLRDKAGVTHGDLSNEIDEVLDKLPRDLAMQVDAIRHIGNFAAHPNKSTNSGEIADVEEGEAEWTLEVLESMVKHYLLEPVIRQERLGKLGDKLKDYKPNAKIKQP